MQTNEALMNNLRLQMSCTPALSSGSTRASTATTFRASSADSCSENCNHLKTLKFILAATESSVIHIKDKFLQGEEKSLPTPWEITDALSQEVIQM